MPEPSIPNRTSGPPAAPLPLTGEAVTAFVCFVLSDEAQRPSVRGRRQKLALQGRHVSYGVKAHPRRGSDRTERIYVAVTALQWRVLTTIRLVARWQTDGTQSWEGLDEDGREEPPVPENQRTRWTLSAVSTTALSSDIGGKKSYRSAISCTSRGASDSASSSNGLRTECCPRSRGVCQGRSLLRNSQCKPASAGETIATRWQA